MQIYSNIMLKISIIGMIKYMKILNLIIGREKYDNNLFDIISYYFSKWKKS